MVVYVVSRSKVVGWDGQRAYSTFAPDITIPLEIGRSISEMRLGGNGFHLGTTPNCCTDYYCGLTVDKDCDLLLTYTFMDTDLIEGEPDHPNSQVLVKNAVLVKVQKL